MIASPSALLRRPDLQPATAQARPMRVCIVGALLEDAYAAVEPATGRAAYTVVVSGGIGPDVVATRWIGDGPEDAIHATQIAAALRAGDVVLVEGDGLRMRQHHGVLALHVCTTTHAGRVMQADAQRIADALNAAARIERAPVAIMDTRDALGLCAPTEAGFAALYALQGRRVRIVADGISGNQPDAGESVAGVGREAAA